MRIISDFKDYYDGVQRTIYDGSVIYKRKKLVMGIPSRYSYRRNFIGIWITFCGKSYYGVALLNNDNAVISKYLYSSDKFEEYVKNNAPDLLGKFTGYNNNLDALKKLEQKENKESLEMWDKYHAPIITWRHDNTHVVNDSLSQYNFQTVKDSFTAFQDIYTYLGGKASPEKELPVLSDEIMRDIKGFDKFSFRKDKSR